MKKNLFIIGCILLSGCHKFHIADEQKHITHETKHRIDIEPHWHCYRDTYQKSSLPPTITQDTIVALGLERSPSIQAQFAQLGIAKADLIQAGFYTNPNLELIFQRPNNSSNGNHTAIELDLLFTISDLWQVPRRKKLAQRTLEVRSKETLNVILEKTTEIKYAFNTWVYALKMLQIETDILSIIEETKNAITMRYGFGLHTQLDKHLITIEKNRQHNNIIESQRIIKKALNAISGLIRIPIDQLKPLDPLCTTLPKLANYKADILYQKVNTYNPLIQIAKARIQRAESAISYERSRRFKDVQFGFSYDKDTDGNSLNGPKIGLSIPIFDTNNAAIERTIHEKKEAEKMLVQEKIDANGALYDEYHTYQSLMTQIDTYYNIIIPEAQNALIFAQKQLNTMQLSILTILETQRALFEAQRIACTLEKMAHEARITIEKLLGTSIEQAFK